MEFPGRCIARPRTGIDEAPEAPRGCEAPGTTPAPRATGKVSVSLLTGGADKPYAFGLGTSLIARTARLEVIGGDELDCPEFHQSPGAVFFNLRGDQRPDGSFVRKLCRVPVYYLRLIAYAATAKSRIFHILWNNKFQWFDRTALMLYYKALGKAVVLTAHNVNAGVRDGNDSRLNRFTLRCQYRLSDHIFVHTERMKQELIEGFGVYKDRVTVIPFGINNAVPNTDFTPQDARRRLGIDKGTRTILFFGNIAPYKGVEHLIAAFRQIRTRHRDSLLIIAGRPKGRERYWRTIEDGVRDEVRNGTILLRADYIPDNETEIYFKAADVLALPYTHIYQSGVLFLGYSFGIPAIATDVGSFAGDIVEGETGFLCKPSDSADLARAIDTYFDSDLYRRLDERREAIRNRAAERHSWDAVANMTCEVYSSLQPGPQL